MGSLNPVSHSPKMDIFGTGNLQSTHYIYFDFSYIVYFVVSSSIEFDSLFPVLTSPNVVLDSRSNTTSQHIYET